MQFPPHSHTFYIFLVHWLTRETCDCILELKFVSFNIMWNEWKMENPRKIVDIKFIPWCFNSVLNFLSKKMPKKTFPLAIDGCEMALKAKWLTFDQRLSEQRLILKRVKLKIIHWNEWKKNLMTDNQFFSISHTEKKRRISINLTSGKRGF